MSDDREADSERLGPENWLTSWEDECNTDWEAETNMSDDRQQTEREHWAQNLWQHFQNSATSIAGLYKDSCQGNTKQLWIPFQNAASCLTIMYKDSVDVVKRSYDHGVQYGHQRRTKELLGWLKKKRRHVRKEELIAYLCGKSPPVRHRPTATLSRSASRMSLDRSSPRLPNPPPVHPAQNQEEPDLRPFRDALALQCLNGAMSNISVGYKPHHQAEASEGADAQQCNNNPDSNVHRFVLEEISRRCDARKRPASSDVVLDSPSRKKNRLL